MSTFNIQSTESIYTGNTALANVSVGDVIVTQHFYENGTDGGAEFDVVNCAPGEPDGFFSYEIDGASSGICARMRINNGIVYAEQLGCVGAAADPGLDISEFEQGYLTWYQNYVHEHTAADGVNADRLQAALDHEDVHEIRMQSAKFYPLAFGLTVELSGKTIDGNGSLLYPDTPFPQPLISVGTAFGEDPAENITIQNVRVSSIAVGYDIGCIKIQNAQNVLVNNVEVLMSCTAVTASRCSQVSLRNIRTVNCIKALKTSGVQSLAVRNMQIRQPCEFYYATPSTPHKSLFYFSSATVGNDSIPSTKCSLERIFISDMVCDNVFEIEGTSSDPAERLSFRDIYAVNAKTVFLLRHAAKIAASDLFASAIHTAADCSDTSNIHISNGLFAAAGTPASAMLELGSEICQDTDFYHCTFNSDAWFNVNNRWGNDAAAEGDCITFRQCKFRTLASAAVNPPAYFGNSVSDMRFYDCDFSVLSLTDDGVFKLYSDADTDSRFAFFGCRFAFDGAGVTNAPLRVSLHGGEDVYTAMLGCTLHDFLWTTRVCKDSNNETGSSIDPAAGNVRPSDSVAAAAAAALTSMERFIAEENVCVYPTPSQADNIYYQIAEEYGIAQ